MHDQQQDEVHGFGEELRQDNSEISKHQDNSAEHLRLPLDHCDDQGIEVRQWLSDGNPIIASPGTFYPTIPSSPIPTDVSTITITSDQQEQEQIKVEGSTFYAGLDNSGGNSPEDMLQQYQQQPDYTPYGGIGYGAQPNTGYFNYAATESSWYGSPSSGGDHTQMVSLIILVWVYIYYIQIHILQLTIKLFAFISNHYIINFLINK